MYEKLTDGIFFEVGGTSTDISCVKDGKVMIQYAEVGGHKTYLNSLDVRTVGIGGGSMVQLREERLSAPGRAARISLIWSTRSIPSRKTSWNRASQACAPLPQTRNTHVSNAQMA